MEKDIAEIRIKVLNMCKEYGISRIEIFNNADFQQSYVDDITIKIEV